MRPLGGVGALVEAGCCLLVFGATLELCVRLEAVYRWGAPFWGDYSLDLLRSSGSNGHFNRPGGRFEKWRINASGFRGPEITVEKPAGVMRVGVVGASEIFGLYESPGKEVTAQLQGILDSAAPGRFEVVNLAAAGMTPPRVRELFDRWAGRFAFDVVVVYSNPVFYVDEELPRQHLRIASDAPPAPARVSFRVLNQAWRRARERLPGSLQDALKRLALERERRRHPPDWVWSSPPSERIDSFESDTAAVVRTIEGTGARVILATHATRFGTSLDDQDRRLLLGWNRFYPRATADCLLLTESLGNDVIRRIAPELGVPVVDLATAIGGRSAYFADFSHFTDEGALRAAEVIVRACCLFPQPSK